jgi:glycine/D-amino acid oxidase-like deaminating enzyme
LSVGFAINAAGVHGADITKMATADVLPVEQKKRQIFAFDCHEKLEGMPLVVDPSGLYFRPENEMFICGLCPPKDEDPTTDSYIVDYNQFEEEIWPLLAQRVPAFEAIKMSGAWAGHYDLNIVDHNPVLGFHPIVTNFVFATGFSGHGLQHSPAVGRGISELILSGAYNSQDLGAFSFDRFVSGNHIIEQNVF